MERNHDTQEHPTGAEPHDDIAERERTSALAAERHGFDALSLAFGLIFVTIAGLAPAGEFRPFTVFAGEWIGPVLLIGIGLLLISTLRRDG